MDDAKAGALSAIVAQVERRVEDGEAISIGMIQAVAGQRAAGPMLLFPALIVVSPLSIIPGLPTLIGLNTILVAGQLALGRQTIWLPRWLTERSLPAKHATKLLGFLKPVTRSIDAVSKKRGSIVLMPLLLRVGAVVCVFVGMIMPLLEFIPFTSTWAGAVIALFALAVTARDGLVAVVWAALVGAMLGVATLLLV